MNIRLRPVSPQDYTATRGIVDQAFETAEKVPEFLDELRGDGCIIGEWLAEDDSGVIAHIAFSRCHVAREDGHRLPACFLTPLAVRPDRQRQGIGQKLLHYALRELELRGDHLIFVIGHPDYYPKAGFYPVPAPAIASPWAGEPAFMMKGAFSARGVIKVPAVIGDAH